MQIAITLLIIAVLIISWFLFRLTMVHNNLADLVIQIHDSIVKAVKKEEDNK